MEETKRTEVPETSTTLLRDVADSQHARWAVFHSRYAPMMRSFMRTRFPSLDADDIIQETFLALAKVLPNYRYNPGEKGHFHNYLTGILRKKALDALMRRRRLNGLKERVATDGVTMQLKVAGMQPSVADDEYRQWRESVYEIALHQFMADETISDRDKQIFTRMAINGESAKDVAAALSVTPNTAYLTKGRLLEKLRKVVKSLKHL